MHACIFVRARLQVYLYNIVSKMPMLFCYTYAVAILYIVYSEFFVPIALESKFTLPKGVVECAIWPFFKTE